MVPSVLQMAKSGWLSPSKSAVAIALGPSGEEVAATLGSPAFSRVPNACRLLKSWALAQVSRAPMTAKQTANRAQPVIPQRRAFTERTAFPHFMVQFLCVFGMLSGIITGHKQRFLIFF